MFKTAIPLLVVSFAFAEIKVDPKAGVAGLERARDAIRKKGSPDTVVLRPGDYLMDRTFELTAADPAGSTYKAQGNVRLIGGVRIRDWKPVREQAVLDRLPANARPHVVVAAVANLGDFSARGFSRDHKPAHSELFVNGRRMTVARWPNEGFTRIADVADTNPQDDEHGRFIGRLPYGFRYEGDRPGTWKPDPNRWTHGYWTWDWADSYERIASLDPATKTIITAAPHGLYGFRKNQRYYFLNVLEELDAPGEYYLDVAGGKVYLYPPASLRGAEVFLSKLDKPVIALKNASRIRVEGVTVEGSRDSGILIEGGDGVTVANCKVRNVGTTGVLIEGGKNHAVERTEISYTGDSAIEVSGGDRKTLTAANHRVEDCDLHHMGEWVRTYNPAVKIAGVGIRAAHNHIHDAPHAGILMTGNDHTIEFNNIHHLALETGDVGAVYIGRDYTERGTVIRNNYIHELGGFGLGSMAVYLDDCASGITVYGNIFYKLKYAAFIGGGRDNKVENNVFVETNPAVHVDARCIDKRPVWHNMTYKTMKPRVEEMRITEPPYSTRYPETLKVLPYLEKTDGVPPEGNVIRRNLFQGVGLGIRKEAMPYVTDVGDNVTVTDKDFFTPATGAFKIPAGAKFEPIPVNEIGIRKR